MVKLEGTYVIDSIENIGRYAGLGANFAKACEFIAKGDFGSLKAGRNDIDGDDVFVNCVDAKYVAQADRPNEIHMKYFDIHVPLAADERIGLGALDPAVKFDFDEASDAGLVHHRYKGSAKGMKARPCVPFLAYPAPPERRGNSPRRPVARFRREKKRASVSAVSAPCGF